MEKTVNLDIVRIFAAGMVLTVHIGQMSGFDFNVGAKGVQLFFILSGYLAFVSLDRNSSPLRYYKKRLLRILPIYWSCLILLYLKDFLFMLFAGNSLAAILEGQCSVRFLRYFLFLQCCLPSDNWDLWNNHSALWTMSSFMVFYLVAPFLYKMLKRFYSSFCVWIIFLVGTPYLARWIQTLLLHYPEESHIEWFSCMNPLTELYCFLGGQHCLLQLRRRNRICLLFL